jgi:hypothetical protein
MTNSSIDFLKGTLDLMILKTFVRAPTHGYGIARWIEQCTDDTLQVEEGFTYPHCIGSRSAGSSPPNGNDRAQSAGKIYRLTATGKKTAANGASVLVALAGCSKPKVLETAPTPILSDSTASHQNCG